MDFGGTSWTLTMGTPGGCASGPVYLVDFTGTWLNDMVTSTKNYMCNTTEHWSDQGFTGELQLCFLQCRYLDAMNDMTSSTVYKQSQPTQGGGLKVYNDPEDGTPTTVHQTSLLELALSEQRAQNELPLSRTAMTIYGNPVRSYYLGEGSRYPRDCSLQVNAPHASTTRGSEIHTRGVNACTSTPLLRNEMRGLMWRSRWYGWQKIGDTGVKSKDYPAPSVQHFRVTSAVDCSRGTWHRYLTEFYGRIVERTGTDWYSSVYEENDNEIVCA